MATNSQQSDLPVAEELADIALWTHPLETVRTLLVVLGEWLAHGFQLLLRHAVPATLLLLAVLLPHLLEGPHSPAVRKLDEVAKFAGWWVGLGILSSIGLGTGLHTFVLYLGPHMAKYAMVAFKCRSIPQQLPSRWSFQYYGECLPESQQLETVGMLTVLNGVYIEALLWGFGTAIGELPPYVVARAARLAGKTEEELKEIEAKPPTTLLERAKHLIYLSLQKHAFLTVLACASIPNPLFDLAGIICGHLLVPFTTFFVATSIGKSFIKTSIQSFMVISAFHGDSLDRVFKSVESFFPFLSNKLTQLLQKQRDSLNLKNLEEEKKNPLGIIWDVLLTLMVGYFVLSLVHSAVNGHRRHKLSNSKKEK